MRRRTAWVKETLDRLKRRGGKEMERGFVTHRTMADLRFLDPAVDANDRKPRWCHLGDPETSNSGPAGLGRFSTLRAWLSQWSVDDSNVNGPRGAAAITVPLLVVQNSADEAAPASDSLAIHQAAGSADKSFQVIKGATHYYQGQPETAAPGHQQPAGLARRPRPRRLTTRGDQARSRTASARCCWPATARTLPGAARQTVIADKRLTPMATSKGRR